MGANLITQVCEYLKPQIEQLSNAKVNICILSNLVDTKLTRVTIQIKNIDPEIGNKIAEASIFAEQDPYRAATNNKGVLNGIDPILIATGNDWRAVEAGVHAYATREGQYRSITKWRMQANTLIGTFEAPVIVGIVGGMTRIHPTAQMCLRMLDVKSAEQLSRVVAATGLVQNLGALRALCEEGIMQGHMKLHISNLMLACGATQKEFATLRTKLENVLSEVKKVTLTDAKTLLEELRGNAIPA
jgi:hydroxymethylglutaryl-CoA reductase